MRELRFRAWDTKEKEMIPEVFIWSHPGQDISVWYDVFRELKMYGDCNWPDHWSKGDDIYYGKGEFMRLMQYTGIKDKNGVEIWEGDIIETSALNDQMKGVVEYNRFRFVGKRKGMAQDISLASKDLIVIGNVHEKQEAAS